MNEKSKLLTLKKRGVCMFVQQSSVNLSMHVRVALFPPPSTITTTLWQKNLQQESNACSAQYLYVSMQEKLYYKQVTDWPYNGNISRLSSLLSVYHLVHTECEILLNTSLCKVVVNPRRLKCHILCVCVSVYQWVCVRICVSMSARLCINVCVSLY